MLSNSGRHRDAQVANRSLIRLSSLLGASQASVEQAWLSTGSRGHVTLQCITRRVLCTADNKLAPLLQLQALCFAMQALQRGLAELAGAGGAEAAADALRIVDTYIKVRYAPILYVTAA